MTIKRLRKIKGQVVRNLQSGEEYIDLPTYKIKQKLDEIVETVNSLLNVIELFNLRKKSKLKADEEDIIVIDPLIPGDSEGHDEQCASSVGFDCDCFKKENRWNEKQKKTIQKGFEDSFTKKK